MGNKTVKCCDVCDKIVSEPNLIVFSPGAEMNGYVLQEMYCGKCLQELVLRRGRPPTRDPEEDQSLLDPFRGSSRRPLRAV